MSLFKYLYLILFFLMASQAMCRNRQVCPECNTPLEASSSDENRYECQWCQLVVTVQVGAGGQLEIRIAALKRHIDKIRGGVEDLQQSMSEHPAFNPLARFNYLTDGPLVDLVRSSLHTAEATFIEATESHTRIQSQLATMMLDIGEDSLTRRGGPRSHQLSLRSMEKVNQNAPLTAVRVRDMFNHVREGNQVSIIFFDRQREPLMSARLLLGLVATDNETASAAEHEVQLILQGQQAVTVTEQSLEVFINHFLANLSNYPGASERDEQRRVQKASKLFPEGHPLRESVYASGAKEFPCEMRFQLCTRNTDMSRGPEEPEEPEDQDLGACSFDH